MYNSNDFYLKKKSDLSKYGFCVNCGKRLQWNSLYTTCSKCRHKLIYNKQKDNEPPIFIKTNIIEVANPPEQIEVTKPSKQLEYPKSAICKHCGKDYLSKSSTHRYCTNECCTADAEKGRYLIFERDKFRCIYCGRTTYAHDIVLHVDHIIPVVRGGKDTADNLVTSCEDCNVSKQSSILANDNYFEIIKAILQRNAISHIANTQRIELRDADKRRKSYYKDDR